MGHWNAVSWLRMLVVVLALAALGGCAFLGVGDAADASAVPLAQHGQNIAGPEVASADPLIGFLASAAPGESRQLTDPSTNAPYQVTAGETYAAASGRTCRRYQTRPVGAVVGASQPQWGLACADPRSGWFTKPILVNPSFHRDLNGQPTQ